MKCGAETCWQEVSVDCEGPNREDREGLRYSLTYFDCLSHAVLLEPMRSLTHSEVRRAFVRCVLRSRTMPSLVRSDRGAEFKNALMAELSVMLGAEWRFSAPLRPCELGANERVHQEVQKVLGAVVRQVGSTVGDTWSDWLVVAEYVIDNTPGPHGYTPRDLERSWSLALPLERDVLRAALEFEPITEWARGQFKQFAELSAAVKAHWDKSSAARAKLANRHRRTVDLKPGDRVVWNAPKARSEGAGRVPWKPGLTGPWRVKDVRGHRLTLEPVPDVPGGTFSGAKGPMEAHAEDCILVPPDAEAAQPREPIVFEDEDHEGGEVSRPSLGQQVAGEAKQVEFTLTRRGRDFILRLGECVAYRGARGGPKSCRLGRVTQVDQARAQVGVHRYLPEVSGVRIKWALAYLKEDGSMTSSEGSRPSIETVSVKEVVTKVDLNRDGVLAASSARKLDKAGYSLQERTALVAPRESACGGLDLAGALSNVLVLEEGPSAAASAELLSVSKWAEAHLPKECLDILEVSWGEPVLSRAARLKGYSVGPAITHGSKAYSVQWDLLKGTHVAAVVGALDLLRPRLLVVTLLGKGVPHCLYQLVVDRAVQRREYLAVCFTAEDGEWKPWAFEGWRRRFGTLSEPTFPWGFVRADNCQFAGAVGRGSPLAEKSCFWLSDFSLSAAGTRLRCGKPDALGNVPHDHGKSKVTSYNLQGAAVCAALPDIGLRGGSDSTPEGVRSLPAAAGPAPAPPQPVPEMPLPDVKSGEDISPAERAKLDKEVEAYALEIRSGLT